MKISLVFRALIEAFGTFAIAFTSLNISNLSDSVLEQSLLIGILVATLIHTFGRISGAHFNPLISFLLIEKVKKLNLEIITYSSFQIFGAIFICFFNPMSFNNDIEKTYSLYPLAFNHVISEFIFTTILLSLVLSWSNEGKLCPFSKPLTGIVVGLGITIILILSSLFSVATLNPAVSLSLSIQGYNPDVLNQIIGQILALVFIKKIRYYF